MNIERFNDPNSADYLHIDYNQKFNDVVISGNKAGLMLLKQYLEQLIASDVDGKHIHLNQACGNFEGNLAELTLLLLMEPPKTDE